MADFDMASATMNQTRTPEWQITLRRAIERARWEASGNDMTAFLRQEMQRMAIPADPADRPAANQATTGSAAFLGLQGVSRNG